MAKSKTDTVAQIAAMTGLKLWKVRLVFASPPLNIHRVTDDEMAVILHAAAELGYENTGRGNNKGAKLKEVTLAMVAHRAGVSDTTAHDAWKKNGKISEQTRKHILNVAREMGYVRTDAHKLKDFYNRKKD